VTATDRSLHGGGGWCGGSGSYVTFFGHGLISHETWVGLDTHCFRPPNGPDAQCAEWQQLASTQIGNLDPYGLDYPVCISRSEPVRLLAMRNRTHLLPNYQYPYDPCRDDYAIAYMNQPSVIKAIHANPNLVPPPPTSRPHLPPALLLLTLALHRW
jgi:hypothetical protein